MEQNTQNIVYYGLYPRGTRAGSGALSPHSSVDQSSLSRASRTKNRPVRLGFSVHRCSLGGTSRATPETIQITSATPATGVSTSPPPAFSCRHLPPQTMMSPHRAPVSIILGRDVHVVHGGLGGLYAYSWPSNGGRSPSSEGAKTQVALILAAIARHCRLTCTSACSTCVLSLPWRFNGSC